MTRAEQPGWTPAEIAGRGLGLTGSVRAAPGAGP